MADAARRGGYAFVPRLKKISGGPCAPSLYRIEAEPVTEKKPTAMPVVNTLKGGIYYTPESILAPSAIVGQAFQRGIIHWTTRMQ